MSDKEPITHYSLWANGQHVADFSTESDARAHAAGHGLKGVTIVPVTRSPTMAETRAWLAWEYRRRDRKR